MSSRTLQERLAGRWRMIMRRAQGRWATPSILRRRYRDLAGRELHLDSPTTMTDKLFARMLLMDQHRDDSVTELVDKYLMRRSVARIVGEDALVPLHWHGTDPAGIPFDSLATPCVLKPNHMTGGVIIITPDLDRSQAVRDASGWLRENMYWPSREYQYFGVERRLVVEQFIDDGVPAGPLDYSFWCFHGEPHYLQMRNHTRDINCFVDMDFVPQDVYPPGARSFTPTRPATFQQMKDIARKLSAPFEFVRVDLYDIHGHIYVGELTFTPAGGKLRVSSHEWDERLGDLWRFDPHSPVLPDTADDAFRPRLLPPVRVDENATTTS